MPGGFVEVPDAAGEDSTALTGTSVGSILSAARALLPTPAPYFNEVGEMIGIRAGGRITTSGSPGTLALSVKFGSTVVWTATTPTLTGSLTNKAWWLELDLRTAAIGASATLIGIGRFFYNGVVLTLPDAPAAGTAFDGRISHQLDLTGQFSAASHSLTTHIYYPVFYA